MSSLSTGKTILTAAVVLVPPTLIGLGGIGWALLTRGLSRELDVAAQDLPPSFQAGPQVAPPLPVATDGTGRAGPVRVSARQDRRAVASGDDLVHVELTLSGDAREGHRTPTDLVVVLDRSGSMGGKPLDDARAATSAIISALHDEDRFALITYDDSASINIPLSLAGAEQRSLWQRQVRGIREGGSTNMSGGLDLGLAMFQSPDRERGQRVILISDGLPNAGDATSQGLEARARGATERNISLSTVGVGLQFDETLMRDIADAGAGNYHYVENTVGLASVFEGELNQATSTVASGLVVTVPSMPGATLLSASGYPLEHHPGGDTFTVGAMGAGQVRTLWLTYRVDTSEPGRDVSLGALSLALDAGGEHLATLVPGERRVTVAEDPQVALASVDADAWGQAVLTEDYNALRQQVADSVKAGDRASAMAAIDSYTARTDATNRVVQSAEINRNLLDLGLLREQVTDSFSGEGQAAKQNVMSKSVGASAYTSRRKGQY